MGRLVIFGLLVVFGAGGCAHDEAAEPREPAEDETVVMTSREDTVQLGRDVFFETCHRCHDYPEIWTPVETEWGTIKMRKYGDLVWTDLLRDADHHQVIPADRRFAVFRYVTADD